MADMEPVLQIARQYGLFVIEDNAQSIGSVYTFSDGTKKQAGTIGDIGTLSFFPTKNLGAYGDGGAMMTDNEQLAKRLKMIASHGQSVKYRHEIVGCNSRLDTLQAAILRVKLPYLDEYNEARRATAARYDAGLETLDWLERPACHPASTHVYNQYTIKVNPLQRNDLQSYLKEKGVPTMIYYPMPLHRQPAFEGRVRLGNDLKITKQLCDSVLSLPMHTELEDSQIEYIIEQIIRYE
jgi:dTDP-4-amino-4,6-dideoxygalactose transaminase